MIASSKWHGRRIEEAIAKWGRPSGIVALKDGQHMVYWGSGFTQQVTKAAGQTISQGNGPTVITDHYVTTNENYECRVEITFNDERIITRFNTWQNRLGGCSDFYWGKNSP